MGLEGADYRQEAADVNQHLSYQTQSGSGFTQNLGRDAVPLQ
jgi:hypothetical protein